MKYKTLMGLSAFALTSFIFSTGASAQTTDDTTKKIIQASSKIGDVKKATFTSMTTTEANKQLKKVKTLSYLPVVSSKKELTEVLIQKMLQFDSNIQIEYNGKLTMDEIKEALHAANQNDYVNGTRSYGQYGYSMKSGKFIVTVTMSYNHTKAQEEELTTAVKKIVADIIKPNMTDVEKVKAVNDYVVTHTDYSKTGTKTSPHSPYTIIKEGKGVCQAYALLTYRLLQEAGIENRYVTGYATESHAWNLVKLDGQWYHLDTTWNDVNFSNLKTSGEPYFKDYVYYKYFLISDASISANHTIDEGYPERAKTDYIPGIALSEPAVLNTSENPTGSKYLLDVPIYKDGTWFITDKNRRILELANGTQTYITDSAAYGMTYFNGKLYYVKSNLYLYSYDLSTGETTNLSKTSVNNIRVINDVLTATYKGKVVYTEKNDETTTYTPVATKELIAKKMLLLSQYMDLLSNDEKTIPMTAYHKATDIYDKANPSSSELSKAIKLLDQQLTLNTTNEVDTTVLKTAYTRIQAYLNERSKGLSEDLKKALSNAEEILASNQNLSQYKVETALEDLLDTYNTTEYKDNLEKLQELQHEVHFYSTFIDPKDIEAYEAYSDLANDIEKSLKINTASTTGNQKFIERLDTLKKKYFEDANTKAVLKYYLDMARTSMTLVADKRFNDIVETTKEADALVANESATEDEIATMIHRLKRVILNAESTIDKTELFELIDQAEAKGNLEDLVDRAEQVANDKKADKTTIQQMIDELKAALEEVNTSIPQEEQKKLNQSVVEIYTCHYPDFKFLVQKLMDQLSKYTETQKQQLPEETLNKVTEVQQRYTKMTNFEQTLKPKQAWTEATKTTKNALKPWTVSLSASVANTVANKKAIKVYNMFGEELEVKVTLDGKKVTITPQQQYEPEMLYTLLISKELTSQSGKKLKNDIYVKFTFNN
ncbi:transglutaminase domain-containing protein [Rummeliibacillus sp. POC4]|uniref:transglutaminase domain-containing protein n=1 Tax=Rummeliibacillus sp. POC4 TaxID=2305899 RepID=UPI000E66A048|nr:transglutaminase domain-containing protein [Rummeliibacillus sp. POC4]RIJ69383.1 hypothetical protein D1606_01055 [Rummeliibacillus sp. POC4]